MRSRAAAAMTAGVVGLIALVGPVTSASASGTVVCTPSGDTCVVVVTDPGDPGTPGSPSTPPGDGTHWTACVIPGTTTVVPCFDPDFGWFSRTDGCYYTKADPQPPLSDPVWLGHTTGAIWEATCLGSNGTGGGMAWWTDPPPGVGGALPDPADLAVQAISDLVLKGPAIRMAPRVGRIGLVGLPVWMWTAVTPSTWGPTSATAAVPGLSVTARAHVVKVVWSMGDGDSVTCTKPGTPYTAARGNAASPDCGHRYSVSSAGESGGTYTVKATSTWQIDWAGGGSSGRLTQVRSSTVAVRIGELQVLVS